MKKIIWIVVVAAILVGLVTVFGSEWSDTARTFLRELVRTAF